MVELRSLRDRVTQVTPPRARRAFTLIELLVVIGIIVALIAITIPAVLKARNTGAITAQKLEFQSIEAGLIAYKQDFQEYPVVLYQDSGSEVLGLALIGPGPAGPPADPASITYNGSNSYPAGSMVNIGYSAGPPENFGKSYVAIQQAAAGVPPAGNPTFWQELAVGKFWDNANGFGSRVRYQGKVSGPYLDATKFRLRGLQILDHWGNPILYFPANSKKPNANISVKTASGTTYNSSKLLTYPYVGQMGMTADSNNNNQYNGANKGAFTSLIDAGDNISAFVRSNPPQSESAIPLPPSPPTYSSPAATAAFNRIAAMLGDYNCDGLIDPSAQPRGESAFTGDYVLWSAGPDGLYGPTNATAATPPTANDIQKCDDVLNTSP